MSKILIIGANGSVGKSCVANLKDDNELVLLSRSAFDGDIEGSLEKNAVSYTHLTLPTNREV